MQIQRGLLGNVTTMALTLGLSHDLGVGSRAGVWINGSGEEIQTLAAVEHAFSQTLSCRIHWHHEAESGSSWVPSFLWHPSSHLSSRLTWDSLTRSMSGMVASRLDRVSLALSIEKHPILGWSRSAGLSWLF